MDRMRSTSPPKSAWPGVSTMLMRYDSPPPGGVQSTAVFLAVMVMPRSRSRSWLSMTSVPWSSWAAKVPDWRSSWSTSVVLP